MKKLIFLLLVFAGFTACENESIQELPQETSVTEGMTAKQSDKIDVCHYDEDYKSWHVINISANAWEGHEKHGDVMLVDADGDGWVANANECVPGGDCNDYDPTENPGAEEICGDGIDNNCDGNVDEGCILPCDLGVCSPFICDWFNNVQNNPDWNIQCYSLNDYLSISSGIGSQTLSTLYINTLPQYGQVPCINSLLLTLNQYNIPECVSGARTSQPNEKGDIFVIE